MILLAVAVKEELRAFTVPLGVETLIIGVGPVEAAIAVARACVERRPAAIVNAGIAGGFAGRANVGDSLVVAVEHLAELGIETGETMTLPGGASLENRADADARLVNLARDAGLRVGSGVTVSSVTATDARAGDLASRFGADVESMEGFAVLRAAALANVPAIELRAISNRVGARATNGWDFRAATDALARDLEHVVAVLARPQNQPPFGELEA